MAIYRYEYGLIKFGKAQEIGGVRMSKNQKEPVRNDANQTLPTKSVNELNASERRKLKTQRTGKTQP